MKFANPVIPGCEDKQILIGEGQPQYEPLPAIVALSDGFPVLFRLELDEQERARVAAGADILFAQLTGGTHFQPIQVTVLDKNLAPEELALLRKVYKI